MVAYICMSDVYKLLYKILILNSLTTTLQVTNFLCDNLFINTQYFKGDSCIVVVIPKG